MKPVNLLPEQYRRRAAGQRRGSSYFLLGGLAALLVLLLVYALAANQVSSRQTDAAEAGNEATALEARVAKLGGFGDFAQIKQARLASVRELAGGRFDWERFVRELAHVLPRGSWLREVDASASGGSGEQQSATLGQPSATLKGCAPRQPETAKLMVRLRRLYRVEDVTLTESAQQEGGGKPSLDSCGRYYGFDLTVVFAAATPSNQGGGRGERVPAALGGGS